MYPLLIPHSVVGALDQKEMYIWGKTNYLSDPATGRTGFVFMDQTNVSNFFALTYNVTQGKLFLLGGGTATVFEIGVNIVGFDMSGIKISNMDDPAANQDASTKKYVDDENLWQS